MIATKTSSAAAAVTTKMSSAAAVTALRSNAAADATTMTNDAAVTATRKIRIPVAVMAVMRDKGNRGLGAVMTSSATEAVIGKRGLSVNAKAVERERRKEGTEKERTQKLVKSAKDGRERKPETKVWRGVDGEWIAGSLLYFEM